MNKIPFALNYAVIGGVTLCGFGGACTSIDWSAAAAFVPRADLEAGLETLASLPPELAFVVDNRGRFASDLSDTLFDVRPGTVVDDTSDLDGCWGSAIFSESNLGDRPLVALYFVHKFDAATGAYTLWVPNDQFGLVLPAEYAGTYSVEGEGRIETRTPDTESYLLTRSGDRMRMHFGAAGRGRVDPGDDELYTRFDCPEQRRFV